VKLSAVDGSLDAGFQASASSIGQIMVRGSFLYASGRWSSPGGDTALMARWSLDTGMRDPNFAPSFGDDAGGQFAFDLQGRIYIDHATGIGRILADGSVDSPWTSTYVGYPVVALAASGAALYVAVPAQFYDQWAVHKLRPSDGAIEPAFQVVMRGQIRALHADADGVWIGGDIYALNDSSGDHSGFLRDDSNGNFDATRTPACLCSVTDIEPGVAAGTLDLYGSIAGVGEEARLGIAQITDQGADRGEVSSVEAAGTARSVVRQADGHVLVGGSFFKVGSHATRNVARFNVNGTLDRGFSSEAIATATVLSVIPIDGYIYLAGHSGFAAAWISCIRRPEH